MTPIFFGSAGRQLYGAYEPPAEGAPDLGRAVLICNPGAQEYHDAHWPLRKLAARLSRAGAHVLRFDHVGTGDSAGETGEGQLEDFERDIHEAAEELRDLSGVDSITLLGLRLGANLALQACFSGLRPRDLVLWDPIADGRAYLAELERADREDRALRRRAPPDDPGTLRGYPLPPTTRAQLERLGAQLRPTFQGRAVIVLREAQPAQEALARSLEEGGARLSRVRVGRPVHELAADDIAVIASAALGAIA